MTDRPEYEPFITACHPEFIQSRQAVALAKLTTFQRECHRLADLFYSDDLDSKTDVVDALWEIACDNFPVDRPGVTDYLQKIMSHAFKAGDEQVAGKLSEARRAA